MAGPQFCLALHHHVLVGELKQRSLAIPFNTVTQICVLVSLFLIFPETQQQANKLNNVRVNSFHGATP